jgi:hypothetical protein
MRCNVIALKIHKKRPFKLIRRKKEKTIKVKESLVPLGAPRDQKRVPGGLREPRRTKQLVH